MALNFEHVLNNSRAIIQGEAAGSVKFLIAGLSALVVWVGVSLVSGWISQSEMTLKTQQGRWHTLLVLSEQYKNLSPSSKGSNSARNVDVPTVFAQVSERMQLGSRVNRITPDGRNQSVEINRLYAEELAELQRQLEARGVKFIAAELRALPAGKDRLMTVSAIIGPMN